VCILCTYFRGFFAWQRYGRLRCGPLRASSVWALALSPGSLVTEAKSKRPWRERWQRTLRLRSGQTSRKTREVRHSHWNGVRYLRTSARELVSRSGAAAAADLVLRYSVEIQLGGMPSLTGLELHFCFPHLRACFPVAPVALASRSGKGTGQTQLCGLKRISRRFCLRFSFLLSSRSKFWRCDPFGGLGIRVREQPFGTP